ncbi:hypothetical protein WUBG_02539 [Wuchereria bancrofti]|uniref:Uncharacterized protein n=1 Tax=Wuchereria bancrofti TaxID=6293 RepID=J9EVG2_WUCBA|nr:hypothetical protein WUBG_02539 [Wuchereria bancrofti]
MPCFVHPTSQLHCCSSCLPPESANYLVNAACLWHQLVYIHTHIHTYIHKIHLRTAFSDRFEQTSKHRSKKIIRMIVADKKETLIVR